MPKSIRELEAEIDSARAKLRGIFDGAADGDRKTAASIADAQSQIAAAVSQIAEISTRRIITLTRWLVGLTIGLLVLTFVLAVYTIRLYQDAHADAHHRSLSEHAQLQRP